MNDVAQILFRIESGGPNSAFYWSEATGARSIQEMLTNDYGLDLSDWNLGDATGVSADGRTIVGTGYHYTNGLQNPGMKET